MSSSVASARFTRDVLHRRGVLSELDWHFARVLARIGGETDEDVLLAAALVSRHVGAGHVCLDLTRVAERLVPLDDAGEPLTGYEWPAPAAWLAALRASALVAAPGGAENTPLVLDARNRLYLRRYWQHEQRIIGAIRSRIASDVQIDSPLLTAGLERLFPDARGGAAVDQRSAALAAVTRRFCVISGGPGTGKTYTVSRILALLVEQALYAGVAPPRVLLMAPTGKAAARLMESIRRDAATLACDEAVRAAVPTDASTIHRALGTVPGRLAEFRHGRDRPLIADVVLVDEASMVDVALMARLFDALQAATRVILLGDQDQLASVEAGAVLGDICNAGGDASQSFPRATSDERRATSSGAIHASIVQLTRSRRYGPQSGIGRLARAINAGDADAALAVLREGGEVALHGPGSNGELGAELAAQIEVGLQPYLGAVEGLAQLRALERFRVLCAHRRGPLGAVVVNQQIEQLLTGRGLVRGGEVFYARRPIIITENDYQLSLFNGDVGVITRDRDDPSVRVACFIGADGAPRFLFPARLPAHETVFAMTVHKSQGSEFDEIAVLLPAQASPVVTRELLYTAVTRARERVVIYAAPEAICHAVNHPVERASGLRDALWG
jgi:exodeoxyribonuclease V alpha subunit